MLEVAGLGLELTLLPRPSLRPIADLIVPSSCFFSFLLPFLLFLPLSRKVSIIG